MGTGTKQSGCKDQRAASSIQEDRIVLNGIFFRDSQQISFEL